MAENEVQKVQAYRVKNASFVTNNDGLTYWKVSYDSRPKEVIYHPDGRKEVIGVVDRTCSQK